LRYTDPGEGTGNTEQTSNPSDVEGAGVTLKCANDMPVGLPVVKSEGGCARYPDDVDYSVVRLANEHMQDCLDHRIGSARLQYSQFVLSCTSVLSAYYTPINLNQTPTLEII
jgi:hypothetical protein